MNEPTTDFLKLVLPEGLFEYFELTSYRKEKEEKGDTLHLYMQESVIIPVEYSTDKLSSKGFFDEVTIQDFPIRGQKVFLHIKRRRWMNETSGKVVFRNWDIIAQGTRITKEFASFLKELSR
jgi:transposase